MRKYPAAIILLCMVAESPAELAERYEKALKRVEQLTTAIVAESVVLFILIFIL